MKEEYYTFPDFNKSLLEYREELKHISKKRNFYRAFLFPLLGLEMLLLVCFGIILPKIVNLPMLMLPFSVLVLMIVILILVILYCVWQKRYIEIDEKIQITQKYITFIELGYTQKDSYRFALQWANDHIKTRAIRDIENAIYINMINSK